VLIAWLSCALSCSWITIPDHEFMGYPFFWTGPMKKLRQSGKSSSPRNLPGKIVLNYDMRSFESEAHFIDVSKIKYKSIKCLKFVFKVYVLKFRDTFGNF